MCLLIFLTLYLTLFQNLLQSFCIALGHISIRTRKKSDWQLLLWLKFPFMVGISFYGLSIYGML